MSPSSPTLPDGVVAVVKRDCPTCTLVAPVLGELAARGVPLTVYSQDDPSFPDTVLSPRHDADLAVSWHHEIDTVPTLLKVEAGRETSRIVGWSRREWEAFLGEGGLGADLPEWRPGCGSLSVDPAHVDALRARFGSTGLRSRRLELAALEDEMEAAFERGWSDGLPVVPPTESRVLRMLEGTDRPPGEVVAIVPPDMGEATVEKVAINAVLAGCRPEYLPVVLTAVEAACTDEFNAHGLLCTTYFSGPVLIVNGPIARRIGMNSGLNALGQGNRANSTIGRALQLVIRNIGGGLPGGIDRAALGSPGKVGWSFAEDEAGSPWEPLSVERGFAPGTSTVSLFAGHGPSALVDQLSRTPESLVRSFAAKLKAMSHPKLAGGMGAVVVVSPEHARVFAEAGWDKARLRAELDELLVMTGAEVARGVGGISEGMPTDPDAGKTFTKFRPGDVHFVHAGGGAGLFSAIIEGWVSGPTGSTFTTREVRT